MKVIITGTVGLNKAKFLEKAVESARQEGHTVELFNVGSRMYAEAPDVAPGRILDLPLARLNQLRRSVFKDLFNLAKECEHLLVNTHATFRWKHGLFPAWDYDQLAELDPDMYVCIVDNVDAMHARLLKDHQADHSLKDLLVWREEELLATEMMMLGCELLRKGPPARFYAMALGRDYISAQTLFRLMFHPEIPKVYLSFPMTHVADIPEIQQEIEVFRGAIRRHFTVFDPADLEEQQLYLDAVAASERGQKVMEVEVLGELMRFDVAEVMQVAGDIHAQIYARDFKLIEQTDMIISYIPRMPDGKPGLSSGVERELQHAYESTREVFVIWRPKVQPSPFVTETATRVFKNIEQALDYFIQTGYITDTTSKSAQN